MASLICKNTTCKNCIYKTLHKEYIMLHIKVFLTILYLISILNKFKVKNKKCKKCCTKNGSHKTKGRLWVGEL